MKKFHWYVTAALLTALSLCSQRASTQQGSKQQPPSAQEPCPCQPPCQFRFIVYGDTRYDTDYKYEDKDKDDIYRQIHQNLVNKVVTYVPSFILQTGDLADNQSAVTDKDMKKKAWKFFAEDIKPIVKGKLRYYPARGNHDVGADSDYEKYVPGGASVRFFGGTKFNYAFDEGDIRFISIDTETDIVSSARNNIEPYTGLVRELESANGKLIIPFFHKAIFSIGRHGKDEKDKNSALSAVLHTLFKKYNIRLVFQGHDHDYYYVQKDGITYVVSGGGGAPLYDKEPIDRTAGDKFICAYNFSVCDVYPEWIEVKTYAALGMGCPTSPTEPIKPFELAHEFIVRRVG